MLYSLSCKRALHASIAAMLTAIATVPQRQQKSRVKCVLGEKSPNPTVAIVMETKYQLSIYVHGSPTACESGKSSSSEHVILELVLPHVGVAPILYTRALPSRYVPKNVQRNADAWMNISLERWSGVQVTKKGEGDEAGKESTGKGAVNRYDDKKEEEEVRKCD